MKSWKHPSFYGFLTLQTLTKLQFLLNEWHSFFGGFLISVLLTKLQYLANCVNSWFEALFCQSSSFFAFKKRIEDWFLTFFFGYLVCKVSTKCELTNLEEEKASTNSDTIIDHVIVYWQISRVSPLGSLLKNALRKFATTFYSWVARDHHVCQSFSIWCCYTPSKEERTRNVIWKTTKLWYYSNVTTSTPTSSFLCWFFVASFCYLQRLLGLRRTIKTVTREHRRGQHHHKE